MTKPKRKLIKLKAHERVIAVVPEYANGPGWSNRPVWVHIVDYSDHSYRAECLQPEEQPEPLRVLFGIGARVHEDLMAWIESIVVRKKT